MAEITWIKLTTNIFEDEKINFLESLPEADMLIVIWLKLLTMAGKINDGGFIYLTEKMPYTAEMLSSKFNRPLNIIKLALQTFHELEMIELIGNKIFISKWEKHQAVDGMAKIKEQNRQRVAKHREKKQLECNVTVMLPVMVGNGIEENKIKNKIKNKETKEQKFVDSKELSPELSNSLIEWLIYKKLAGVKQFEYQYKAFVKCTNPVEAVEHSIGNGYKGLFEPKKSQNNYNKVGGLF